MIAKLLLAALVACDPALTALFTPPPAGLGRATRRRWKGLKRGVVGAYNVRYRFTYRSSILSAFSVPL